jgi:uncharacterized membrane protein
VTPGRRRRSWVALAIVLSVSFAALAHFAVVEGVPAGLGALLSLVPVAILVAWAVRRTRNRVAALALAAFAMAAAAFGWETLQRHFPDLFFIEHFGVNLALAILFGHTLARGREPLVTRLARLLHGTLDPRTERYTRGVTLAWTLFFAAMLSASCILYLGHFRAAWSWLAYVANPVLVAAVFVAEYAIRTRVLPDHERVGILGGIRAFSRHFGTARFEAPR